MALPIYGKYISKVYADPTLHYSQESRFEFPGNINLCEGELGASDESETIEETISGAFD